MVQGGRTRIGIDMKELERLLDNDTAAQNFAGALIGETPHQDMWVDPLWLMTTEVTQEQYAAFVRATGAAPLETWCEDALRDASVEFARAEERAASEARAGNRPPPTRHTFDRHAWWLANAKSAQWALAESDRARPAAFVDYTTARAYSRWAGLRLPTEFEFQRAVRGDTAQTYPWGNDWDNDKFAVTSLLRKKGNTWPVASFPAGRTRQGVYDLAGNVWEWTQSPYGTYPGYQQRVFEFGYGNAKRTVNAIADWNAEQRVVVGGSFQTTNLMCRASVRRGTDRAQTAGALGFRCASSPRAGVDMAQAILDDDFDVQLRPRVDGVPVEYAVELTLCANGWSTAVSQPIAGWTAPEHYAIISDYRYVLFTPVRQVPATDPAVFERRSVQEEPVHLGFLATNLRLVSPALDPGIYLVSYRARGMRRFGEAKPSTESVARAGEAPLEEKLHLDVNFDHVILSDLRGQPLVALRQKVEYGPDRESRVESFPGDVAADGAPATPRTKRVRLDAWLACRTTKKGFALGLDLRIELPDPDVIWRR